MNVLLGLSGSVACKLSLDMAVALQKAGHKVQVVMTKSAKRYKKYIRPKWFHRERISCYTDKQENKRAKQWVKGDPITHIALSAWADVLLIAPLSANTLEKLANGSCDNLLTSIYRAWHVERPVIVAPAMNTEMWDKPITEQHIRKVQAQNVTVIDPVEGKLACGVTGVGAMARIPDIVNAVCESVRWSFPLYYAKGIPVGKHPGAFLTERKSKREEGATTRHTGVDLYTCSADTVRAVESGTVVGVEQFTGAAVGSPWWLDTDVVLIEGISGVVAYGEIRTSLRVGDKVRRDSIIGIVTPVLSPDKLRTDIPGHSCSMLHMELYARGTKRCSRGYRQDKDMLRDPTPFLLNAKGAPHKFEL